MPIVDVDIVEGTIASKSTQALADAIGKAFGADPGRVWVRARSLPAAAYAENDQQAPQPVFVTITASKPPEGQELRRIIATIVADVAHITGRNAEHVHVEFAPAARGRIAFGGRLVE